MSTEQGRGVGRWLAKAADEWILMAATLFGSAGTWRWAGAGLGVWAMRENPFFLPVLPIGAGPRVARRGPHAPIRHPGYASAILVTLAMPYLLDSSWAAFPAGLSALLIVVRTWAQDRTLQAELPGYRERAQRVRSRLAPASGDASLKRKRPS